MGVERKSAVLTEDSKRLTAYHEAGHAVVAMRTNGGGHHMVPITHRTPLHMVTCTNHFRLIPNAFVRFQ